MVARLHSAFAAIGVYSFDLSDVEAWSQRIERMAKELLMRIELLHKEGAISGVWVGLADRRAGLWVEIAVESLKHFYGLKRDNMPSRSPFGTGGVL